MHEEFDAARHMVCHRCYGTTFAHYNGKKIYPERPCEACKGKGFHDRNFPFAQWMSSATTVFLLAPLRPRRTRSLVDAACPVCHGDQHDAYGHPCKNCRGSGRVLADTNYQPKVDLHKPDAKQDAEPRTAFPPSTAGTSEGDSGADWPPLALPPKTDSGTSQAGKNSATASRLSIAAVALIFVGFLAFVAVRFIIPNPNTTQTSIVTTNAVVKPPDLPIIGGAETAFFAKYGSPLKTDVVSGTTIETLNGNISIAIYPTNHSVTGIIAVANAAGWSDDTALAQCAAFFPQDTRLGQRHNVTDPHNALDAWFKLGQSTLLASTLPPIEFADPNHSVDAGTFIAEVYTNGPGAHTDNECSVKLSDVVVQPTTPSGTPISGPSGTQVAGVPTAKPGIPSPLNILAPTQTPIVAGPTPTQVVLDVPTPTVGPTQTPLPTPTNTTAPAPTATPVVPTSTTVPPTAPPTAIPTTAPTDVPTTVPTDTPTSSN